MSSTHTQLNNHQTVRSSHMPCVLLLSAPRESAVYKTRLCRAPFPVLLLLLLLRTLSPLSLEVLNVAEDELLEPARRLLTKVRQVEGRLDRVGEQVERVDHAQRGGAVLVVQLRRVHV